MRATDHPHRRTGVRHALSAGLRSCIALLALAGWVVQDRAAVNLAANRGVAVREVSFDTGEPDYTLFVDGKALGTVEAKPVGSNSAGIGCAVGPRTGTAVVPPPSPSSPP